MPDHQPTWKVRAVKPYPEAHNHLLIGQVLERDTTCVELLCRSFHLGRSASSKHDVAVGELARRIIPWNRIEIINRLPDSFDFRQATIHADGKGDISFTDGHYHCPIVTSRDRHY